MLDKIRFTVLLDRPFYQPGQTIQVGVKKKFYCDKMGGMYFIYWNRKLKTCGI